jgi:hypothetical protein
MGARGMLTSGHHAIPGWQCTPQRSTASAAEFAMLPPHTSVIANVVRIMRSPSPICDVPPPPKSG